MKKKTNDVLEIQELIQKLIDKGFGDLVEAALLNENKIYTKKNRLNKSGLCRLMGWKPKQVEEALNKCKDILYKDVN